MTCRNWLVLSKGILPEEDLVDVAVGVVVTEMLEEIVVVPVGVTGERLLLVSPTKFC